MILPLSNSTISLIQDFIISQGDYILKNWEKVYTVKVHPDNVNLATNYDLELERLFKDFLGELCPDHGFYGEELSELRNSKEYTWYVDVIDGSKYFIEGVPLWCISVCLMRYKAPLLGFVYNPNSKQFYLGKAEQGTTLNGRSMQVKSLPLAEAQVAWDFPYTPYSVDDINQFDNILNYYKLLRYKCYRVRDFGNGALSLSWIAQGVISAYISPYRPKDEFINIAAGIAIAREAGAKIFRRNLDSNLEHVIVAPDPILKILTDLYPF